MWTSKGWQWAWLWLVLAAAVAAGPACRISEFSCRNGRCVRLDRYCDGRDDCGDLSDEPPYCTVCNRTYYGDVGKTYELNLTKPHERRVPFLCHLTFTANGHVHGDVVQLLFDSFNVGRFDSSALDGCPDGYMQLSELGRPFTGGSWCGSSTGYAVYYSETSTITVSVKLFRSTANVPFEFVLRYKFITQTEAAVRFGSPDHQLERGQVSPGTYCTRKFEECYRKPCRLQSPNYPGMYPRNVTCYWSLRQKEVPTCKHAMISVRQEDAHKMQMKRSINLASFNRTVKTLRTWRECTGEKDHLIFYDGGTTNDPVLFKYCGGDWLPRIVSRGPDMLVAFHSSPFSVPLHSALARSPLRGFELDIDVIFTDSSSYDFSRNTRCHFDVNATQMDGDDLWYQQKGRIGRVYSPRHTLPPNTTCTYSFHGQAEDLVWIYFMSFYNRPLFAIASEDNQPAFVNISRSICTARLRILDGLGRDSLALAEHCEGELPRLCDHKTLANQTRTTRPCGPHESYISSGSQLKVQYLTEDGTALHPAFFKMRYEFVDTRLGGEPWDTGVPELATYNCTRLFRGMRRGEVTSPRNVFLYGRGGASNLSCMYRIEAGPGERVRLQVHNLSLGQGSGCETEPDPHTARPRCGRKEAAGRSAEFGVWDAPWRDVRLSRACLCDNSSASSSRPLVFTSLSRTLELHFRATNMNVSDDFTNLYFNASFETVRMPECQRSQRLRGSGGEVGFSSPAASRAELYCEGLPWSLEARENRSLFLLTWGTVLPTEPAAGEAVRCVTKNRILVYSGAPMRLVRAVCPSEPNTRQLAVHIFSEEWFAAGKEAQHADVYLLPPQPPRFIVEFVGREAGGGAFSWLEISRSKSALLQQLQVEFPVSNLTGNDTLLPQDWECLHRCPELQACISPSLWCDGTPNCPSGFDENEFDCGSSKRLIGMIPGGIYTILSCSAAAIAALLLFLVFGIAQRVRSARRKRRLGKEKLMAADITKMSRRPTVEDFFYDPASTASS